MKNDNEYPEYLWQSSKVRNTYSETENLITGVDKKGLCLYNLKKKKVNIFSHYNYITEIKSRHTCRNQRNILLNYGNCYFISTLQKTIVERSRIFIYTTLRDASCQFNSINI